MATPRRSKIRSAPPSIPVSDRRGAPPDWIIVALAVVGLLITAYLSIVSFTGSSTALCAEGSGCDIVQQSRWSILLGLPIALWGFATYALLALFSVLKTSRLRRWRRSWWIALLGVSVSVYLTVAGLVALDAVCVWCLLSLATICAIFIRLAIVRPDSAPGGPWRGWLINTGLAAVVLVGLLHAYYSGLFQPPENPRLSALATHLTDTGAKYYGAFWCPNCQEQKRLFGSSADRLPYVECSPGGRGGAAAFDCVAAEVTSYPTWIIRGRKIEGLKQPEELARLSGFRWIAPEPE
jgi:uncharacterized membrane protein